MVGIADNVLPWFILLQPLLEQLVQQIVLLYVDLSDEGDNRSMHEAK